MRGKFHSGLDARLAAMKQPVIASSARDLHAVARYYYGRAFTGLAMTGT